MEGVYSQPDTWERKEDLGNAKEVLEEFEGRMKAEERDFRREELPGKFTAKMLYR